MNKNSSLAQQLDALAGREAGAQARMDGVRSYLFDTHVAASYGIDAIYGMGLNGLLQLSSADARFERFVATLFAPADKTAAPELRTQAQVDAHDAEIERLCALLAAHFASRAAAKVVEYLVRNYAADRRARTVDALLFCALPCHETAAFARLLPVLTLAGKWEWLRPLAHRALPLPRARYVAQCRADRTLLAWTVAQARRVHALGAFGRATADFVAALAAEVLAVRPSDALVRAWLPLVVHGLRAPLPARAFRAVALVALAQAAAGTLLSTRFLGRLLAIALRGIALRHYSVAHHIKGKGGDDDESSNNYNGEGHIYDDEENAKRALVADTRLCLTAFVHVCETQRARFAASMPALPATALRALLAAADTTVPILAALSTEGYPVDALVAALLQLILDHGLRYSKKAQKESEKEDNDDEKEKDEDEDGDDDAMDIDIDEEEEEEEEGKEKNKEEEDEKMYDADELTKATKVRMCAWKTLVAVLRRVRLSSALLQRTAEQVLGAYARAAQGAATDIERRRLQRVLRALAQQHPAELDRALDACVAGPLRGDSAHWLFQLVAATFAGTVHEPLAGAGRVLAVALNHPSAAVRVEGLRRLSQLWEEGEVDVNGDDEDGGNEDDGEGDADESKEEKEKEMERKKKERENLAAFARDVVLRRLDDDEEDVLVQVLAMPWALRLLEPRAALQALLRVLRRTDAPRVVEPCLQRVVELATTTNNSGEDTNTDTSASLAPVVAAVWEHFALTPRRRAVDLLYYRACASLRDAHPLFAAWPDAVPDAADGALARPQRLALRRAALTGLAAALRRSPALASALLTELAAPATRSPLTDAFSLAVLLAALAPETKSATPALVWLRLAKLLAHHVLAIMRDGSCDATEPNKNDKDKKEEDGEEDKKEDKDNSEEYDSLSTPDECADAVLACIDSKSFGGVLPGALLTACLTAALRAAPVAPITAAQLQAAPRAIAAPEDGASTEKSAAPQQYIALVETLFCGTAARPLRTVARLLRALGGAFADTRAFVLFGARVVYVARGACARVRALNTLAALAARAGARGDTQALAEELLPMLMYALQDEQRLVRNAALGCNAALARALHAVGNDSAVALADAVASARTELLAEPSFLAGVCGQIATGHTFAGVPVAPAHSRAFGALLADYALRVGVQYGPRARLALLVPAGVLACHDTLRYSLPLLAQLSDPSTTSSPTASATATKKDKNAKDEDESIQHTVAFILGLHTPETAPLLCENGAAPLAALAACMAPASPHCFAALARVTPAFWAALSPAGQARVLAAVVAAAAFGEVAVKAPARAVLATLAVTPDQLAPYFDAVIKAPPQVASDKKNEKEDSVEEKEDKELEKALAQLNVILESLHTRGGEHLAFLRDLVPRIFGAVGALIDPAARASHAPSREYTLQVALTALAAVTTVFAQHRAQFEALFAAPATSASTGTTPRRSGSGGPPRVVSAAAQKRERAAAQEKARAAMEGLFDIALVTRCMRAVSNPQVHVQCLALVACVAPLLPDLIMRHVVDILSFIATAAMTQDDMATFDMLGKTIESIVPPMLRSSALGAAPLLRALLDGFHTIPRHRRLALFRTVVTTISVARLGLVLVALLTAPVAQPKALEGGATSAPSSVSNKSGKNGVRDENDDNEDNDLDSEETDEDEAYNDVHTFARKLCLLFPSVYVVTALKEVVSYARAALAGSSLGACDAYWFAERTPAAMQRCALSLLTFVDEHVGSQEFVLSLISDRDAPAVAVPVSPEIPETTANTATATGTTSTATATTTTAVETEPALASQEQFLALFEDTVAIVEDVPGRAGMSKGTARAVAAAASSLLSALKGALSVPVFVAAVARLLQSAHDAARRTGLVLLNERLEDLAGALSAQEAALFLDGARADGVLALVVRMLGAHEHAVARQTALLTLEILARSLAGRHPDAFEPLLARAVAALHDPDDDVVASAQLCVATLVAEIGPLAVPHLADFFPAMLDRLDAALRAADTEGLHATLSAVLVVVRHIARFLSPYAPRLMALLLQPALVLDASSAGASSSDSASAQLAATNTSAASSASPAATASRILAYLTENLEPRLLLDPIFAVYTDKTAPSAESLLRLFEVIGDVTRRMRPSVVALHYKRLLKFYLDGAFNFRRDYGDRLDEDALRRIEERIVDAFVQLVLKLNENMFKPLFLKVNEHFVALSARDRGDGEPFGMQQRYTALFYTQLLHALAAHLRAIFSPFTGFFCDYLLEHLRAHDCTDIVAHLKKNGGVVGDSDDSDEDDDDDDDDDEDEFDDDDDDDDEGDDDDEDDDEEEEEEEEKPRRKTFKHRMVSRKRMRDEVDLEQLQDVEARLVAHILDTLTLCFMYDNQGFVDASFSSLVAVTEQLDNVALGAERYAQLMKRSLIPCVAQLAAAVTKSKQEHWSALNHQLLLRSRNPAAEMRLWTLRCMTQMWHTVGEEIVSVMPETVPYLSELLQDSDPEVEAAANELAEVMQSYLGEESLRDYL